MLFFDCTNMTCFFSYLVSKLTTLKLPWLNKTLFKRKQAAYLKYSEEPNPAQFKENTLLKKQVSSWIPNENLYKIETGDYIAHLFSYRILIR